MLVSYFATCSAPFARTRELLGYGISVFLEYLHRLSRNSDFWEAFQNVLKNIPVVIQPPPPHSTNIPLLAIYLYNFQPPISN